MQYLTTEIHQQLVADRRQAIVASLADIRTRRRRRRARFTPPPTA